jgi:short subunit dehydrogenase-like uncharacterized protein
MSRRLLIYGATGFTGRLMAAEARARGLDVVLAGRNPEKLRAVAEPLGFPWTAVELDDSEGLAAAFRSAHAVLNIAGPFAVTARPVIEACLRAGAHYLDVTGELEVFRQLHGYDAEARARGLMIMPGVGFAIVATDCLAAHVARRLPEAHTLRMGLSSTDAVSRGTLRTMLSLVDETVAIRRNGRLVTVAPGQLERPFDYGKGASLSTALSWPDVFTAYFTTGIPNIEVYVEASPWFRNAYRLCRWVGRPMRLGPVRKMLELPTRIWPEGPSEEKRAAAPRVMVAEAEDRWRRKVVSRLYTPDGYDFTAPAALQVAGRALAGETQGGFRTPAAVYGADFILPLPGVRFEDVDLRPWTRRPGP